MSENPPTTDMFFGDEDNPTMWFTEFQRMLPLTWMDREQVAHFTNHIVPNSYASDWFNNLTNIETADLTTLRRAFNIRWPLPECPKFSQAEQMEHIREQVLKEESIGKWTMPSDKRKANYGQNIWANGVIKAGITMEDTAGFLIDCAVDDIPHLLKDHLTCRYNMWDEFKTDVRSILPHKIKQGKEKLEKERARDAEIVQLHVQTSATAATLQSTITQLSNLHLSHSPYSSRPPPIISHQPIQHLQPATTLWHNGTGELADEATPAHEGTHKGESHGNPTAIPIK
ncbi:hypothetical protein HD554DRAFT_2170266 [Boletus coccyginus]|nr:hypothetical protein HD554DRAFT_2170266 [Boletus coccyginus]